MELKTRVSAAISMKKVYIAVLSVIWLMAPAGAFTDSQDVYALNQLYISLGSPPLNGWNGNGGDPCAEFWEGVACAGPNVTLLNLTGLGLMGGLGTTLQNLTALIVLDLSNNLLSGDLPGELPPHAQQLNLSINQYIGSLPLAFAEISNLASLDISNNLLSGTLPDIFNPLEALTMLDFSSNGFDGSLPPSFAALTSLNNLYLQDNSFTGAIDVLAKLPLTDLDLSNNSFTGWIPSDFRKFPPSKFTGNSFSTSPAPPPPPPSSVPPSPPDGPKTLSAVEKSPSSKQEKGLGGYLTVGRLIGFAIAGLLSVVVAVLVILLLASRRQKREEEDEFDTESSWHKSKFVPKWKGEQKQPYVRTRDQKEGLEPVVVKALPKACKSSEFTTRDQKEELETAVKAPPKTYKPSEFTALKPPPVPLESLKPRKNKGSTPTIHTVGVKVSIAAQAYTIAELQIATQSFAEENHIGNGTLGKVYKAQMPNGQFVAVKKLDYSMTRMEQEHFLEFLSKISRLHHGNIIELVGYCVEHGERLLVYKFVGNGSVHENLHLDFESKKMLSWKARVKIALGVAKGLEYLHEKCKPAIFHRNLTSNNILLDDDLTPHLSDCGLAIFFQHEQASAEHLGYSAPEHTSSGIYTTESDIYSFGVVMLELLTGRKAMDSTRPRSEQSLVRWAVPQLHDIDALAKMLDTTIEETYSKKSVSRFADVISQCVQTDPKFRPSMSEVVQYLEQLQEM